MFPGGPSSETNLHDPELILLICPSTAIPMRGLARMKFWQKFILLLCAMPIAAIAQEPSPNSMVRTWTDGAVSPAATIHDVLWFVGDWEGELEGGMQQSTTFSPTKGHMPGFARGWGQDGSIWFYEINDFIEVNGSIEFRVKHFSGDLEGWEGKSEFVRHRLIEMTNKVIYFDGLTVVKEGPEHYTVYVRITEGEKKGQVIVVHQTRVSKR
jgi:hypothetical protein